MYSSQTHSFQPKFGARPCREKGCDCEESDPHKDAASAVTLRSSPSLTRKEIAAECVGDGGIRRLQAGNQWTGLEGLINSFIIYNVNYMGVSKLKIFDLHLGLTICGFAYCLNTFFKSLFVLVPLWEV